MLTMVGGVAVAIGGIVAFALSVMEGRPVTAATGVLLIATGVIQFFTGRIQRETDRYIAEANRSLDRLERR